MEIFSLGRKILPNEASRDERFDCDFLSNEALVYKNPSSQKRSHEEDLRKQKGLDW